MKKHKYGAIKVKDDGYTFDSKMEYRRYKELLILQRAGEIQNLMVHPFFTIEINDIMVSKVILDFAYHDKNHKAVYEDVKGFDTPISRLKRKLVKAVHGIDVEVIKK